MPKISGALRHLFTVFCTLGISFLVVWWAVRPIQWRIHLYSLLARSFGSFTHYLGNTGAGFVVSVLVSSLLTIVLTVIFIGVFRGASEMRRHWVETALIGLLVIIAQILILYGPIYLRQVTSVTFEDHQNLANENMALAEKISSKNGEIRDLKKQLEDKRSKPNEPKPAISVPTQTPSLPPPIQDVRIVKQEWVSSTIPTFRYELRLVIQTNVPIQPISFLLTCNYDAAQMKVEFSGDPRSMILENWSQINTVNRK